MNQELEIWQFAAEKLERDESVVLLLVAESSGSSPGRQGFKMIVAADEMCGSIGGGIMEVQMAESAKWKLTNGKWKMETENPESKIPIKIQNRRAGSPEKFARCERDDMFGKTNDYFLRAESQSIRNLSEK